MTDPSEGMTDPRLQAQGELSMARLALDDGELRHAADHVARALVCDPVLPEAHELLAALAAHPRGGADLFPLDQPVFLGTVVARAHVLASRGEPQQALSLLVSAQSHEPGGAWADVPWMRDPALPARLAPDDVSMLVMRLASGLGDPVPEDERPPLRPFCDLARAMCAAHPGHGAMLWTSSILMRRVGATGEAIELAARSESVEPSFHAAMALGYAYRAERRYQEAEQAWLRALRFDPGNLALYTDIGELLALAGRPADGLAWVERALQQDPRDPSAFPTACGMRFERDGDLAHLVALADYMREHPDNGHADSVLTHHSQRLYWLGHIPQPGEAVINVLRQVLSDEGPQDPTGISLTISAPEPPSALLAFAASLGVSDGVTITQVPEPDARRPVPEVFADGPVRAVRGSVWAYQGTLARPAMAPPSQAAVQAVHGLAGHRWRHLPAAYDDAVRLSGLSLNDLLGLLVHPPVPHEVPPLHRADWIRSVQAWTCLGIAHFQADQPWHGSERRAVLVDLAYGPEDWVSEMALAAMIATAWVDPGVRADVAELVAWRFMAAIQASQSRPVTVLESLAFLVRATPDVHPEVRSLADDVVAPPDPRATA
ncbi:tetratricopeptide repeat protein [Actinomadura miaoliensis]|uniref:Tetratricopeptide repeat protein n=1 Tax=Actinomadura miaoliensis TaxID=430685 RepID=A0ABP7WWE8_9ACTN